MEKWLCATEEKYHIDILFACEAGSRAWGTDDVGSDYDIRFIFKHRDIKEYLSLERAKDVIDSDTPFDAHGWDIFKALELMKKSNPSIYEWTYSPIIYRDKRQFSVKLKRIVENDFSKYKLFQHYRQLMTRNLKEAAKKETMTEKKQKLLIQAVRAFLIARQILAAEHLNGHFLYRRLFFIKGESDFVHFYRELAEEKQNGSLINGKYADIMLGRLEKEKEAMLAAAEKLNKGSSQVTFLNEWLWELIGI
ncbi:nucleotidyltransferase domain-containing protein [Bacillus sp. ISL-47]|uniref:nucleotidyltransferase domain-containing protein n=1 Tax=Bacillus sp. ISL-47 TaxID=2819130 RepID=UPI001BE8F00B|nr:nucleotidyltransferase domain-containing protein [Bacillus sp. ISL-47]MBT2690090.1 nucleotidyltransferase domain-containing protein [Bacillus sp. ISL-47]MBT2707886.1 nucleotidyltransferase domain-containing protein [Pseudomonas sp. ISL-84]